MRAPEEAALQRLQRARRRVSSSVPLAVTGVASVLVIAFPAVSPQALGDAQILIRGAGRFIARSTPSSADCNGTCRCHAGAVFERLEQPRVHVPRLDRGQAHPPQTVELGDRHEQAGQPRASVPPGPEVDAAEHDLAAAAGDARARGRERLISECRSRGSPRTRRTTQ